MKNPLSKDSGLIILNRPLLTVERSIPPIKVDFGGMFRLQTRKPDGKVSQDTGWFKNLITNQGLNRIGTAGIGDYVHVGSGSTTPANANTALAAFIAATNAQISAIVGVQGSAPYYGKLDRVWRFGTGIAAGTIAEVGTGWSDSGNVLFSRALVLDGGGLPTTIVVQADEVLDVGYSLRLYVPTVGDVAGSVSISSVNYNTVTRPSKVTGVDWQMNFLPEYGLPGAGSVADVITYNGSLGATTEQPSGTSGYADTTTFDAYSNNSLERVFNMSFGLDSSNLAGGIKSIFTGLTYRLGAYQTEFTPAIPKDATKVLNLSAKIAWGRH